MVVGRWCTNHRYRAREVLEVVKETCQAVLLENVVGLAHADVSGRSNVDAARECFGELGDLARRESAISFFANRVAWTYVRCSWYVRMYVRISIRGRLVVAHLIAQCRDVHDTCSGYDFHVNQSDAAVLGSAAARPPSRQP